MTPEGKVKKFVEKYMDQHFPEAWKYNPPGGAFGRAGTPDKFYLYKGVFIAIEVKADNGSVTKLQMKTLQKLKEQGCIAAIVKGCDEHRMDLIRKAVKEELVKRGVETYG